MKEDKAKQLVEYLEQHPELPTDGASLVEYLDRVMGPSIGRPARKATSQDLSPVFNRLPANYEERRTAFLLKKRAGYTPEVSEELEFADFSGDGSGYQLNDDGEYGYEEDSHDAAQVFMSSGNGFGNQW